MKKTVIMLFAVGITTLFCSCTTYYKDSGADYLIRPRSVSNAPYCTEYTLKNERVQARGEASVLLGIFQIAENKRCLSVFNPNLSILSILDDLISPTFRAVTNAKSIALYNACEQNNADQLLGVTFDYIVHDYFFFARVDCTVRGFPAKIKGLKMIEKKPIILNKWQKIEYIAPHENPRIYDAGNGKRTLSLNEMFK